MRFMLIRKADNSTEAGALHGQQLLIEMLNYMGEMGKEGILLAGEGLQPSSKGSRVKFSSGKPPTVIDGPFTETKELIAGFTLIQVNSRQEAIDWVKRWPTSDGDGNVEIEIRQLFEAEDFGPEFTPQMREAEEKRRSQAKKGSLASASLQYFFFNLSILSFAVRYTLGDSKMKYMLLIYADENAWTDPERQQCYRESTELAHTLKSSGHFLGTSPLQSVSTATSVQVRDGKRLVTDGPFAETREQLGGFFMIEAKNLDEAIDIAGRIPGARKGTVEIRPVVEIPNLPID